MWTKRWPILLFFLHDAGAFGYFEVTHDITRYCKAKVFEYVGKTSPIAVRFSTVGKKNHYRCLGVIHIFSVFPLNHKKKMYRIVLRTGSVYFFSPLDFMFSHTVLFPAARICSQQRLTLYQNNKIELCVSNKLNTLILRWSVFFPSLSVPHFTAQYFFCPIQTDNLRRIHVVIKNMVWWQFQSTLTK